MLDGVATTDQRTDGQGGARPRVIEINGLSLTFETRDGPVYALSDVDLVVEQGEFVSFIGPSGCGKTTLLRVVADLETGTAGRVLVNGVPPDAGAARTPVRLRVPGPGPLSLAHGRAQRHAAAGDHGVFRRRAPRARTPQSRAGQSDRFRAQVPLAAFGRHAAARLDRARALLRSAPAAHGRALRRARRDRPRQAQ